MHFTFFDIRLTQCKAALSQKEHGVVEYLMLPGSRLLAGCTAIVLGCLEERLIVLFPNFSCNARVLYGVEMLKTETSVNVLG